MTKESWKDLSDHDRSILENEELKKLCRKSKSYSEKRYLSNSDREKEKKHKKDKWSRLGLRERGQYLKDSISRQTGIKYDTVHQFLITPFEFWSCGLRKKKKRIDIINGKGKIIYKAKAESIPTSLKGTNYLFTTNRVFVKTENKHVFIDHNEVITPADQYHNVHFTSNFILAFLEEEDAYPLHLYDTQWRKVTDYVVYGLQGRYEGKKALVKKSNGEYALKNIEDNIETLEGVEFDCIQLRGEKTKVPMEPKDKFPIEYKGENGLPPRLERDFTAGYNDTKVYTQQKMLLDLFKPRSNNRSRPKTKPPSFYSADHPQGQRIVAEIHNMVYLDTIVQKFISVKGDTALVAEIDGQTKEIPLINQKRSFFKRKIRGTKMYITSTGDSTELRNVNGEVLQRVSSRSRNIHHQMTPYKLMDDRQVLHLNNEKSVLLDDQGKELYTIEKMNPNWLATDAAHPDVYTPLDYQVIGKTFLKVYHPKPYLINLETMKVFRE